MGFKHPTSVNQCLYFTNRNFEDDGKIKAWAYKLECPKCKKGIMGKPVVKGKVKIRAKEYACPECGYTEDKFEHEKNVVVQAAYTCPYCKKEGESETDFKFKSWRGVKAYVVLCEHCNEKIGITKRMAFPKK
ncbi:hypothetical protein GOV05_03670 [Candidatus Woesearchaeota archaeon]|nr:hypothetical protein [Candidatus Woesearchaeota archaeon]